MIFTVDFLLPNRYFDLIIIIIFCPELEYLKIQWNTVLAKRQQFFANITTMKYI